MDQSSSNQMQDHKVLDTSVIIPEEHIKPDVTQNLLNNGPKLDEILEQLDSKFDEKYILYNIWLYLMILASGLLVFSVTASTYNAWKFNHGFQSKLFMLLFLAFTIWVFSQFIIEKWAIFNKDLSKANLGLVMITVNSLIFLGLLAYAGYSLYEFNSHMPEPSESTSFTRAMLTFFLIVTSLLSVTNVLFTNIPAIKVRNDLIQREAIRARLEVSLVK